MNINLKSALTAGWFSIIVAIPALIFEYLRNSQGLSEKLMSWHVLSFLTLLIAYIIFLRGVDIIGQKLNNSLLRFGSWLLMIVAIGYFTYLIFNLLLPDAQIDSSLIGNIISVCFGLVSVMMGKGMLVVQNRLGLLAKIVAILNFVCAAAFISIKFSLLGIGLLFGVTVATTKLLTKAISQLK